MRLAQLARKLGVRPSEIIDFLASKQITVDEKSNLRLEEEQIRLILQRFEESPEVPPQPEPVPLPEPIVIEDKGEQREDVQAEAEDPEEGKVEVIKAQRIELTGLKVIGKIDLPEPKKKPIPSNPEAEPEPSAPAGNEQPKRPAPLRRDSRPARKNPIAQKREQEEVQKEEEKKARSREAKEQRTRNYQNRIKSAPTKQMRLVEEETDVITEEIQVIPKTWFGRFVRWLKT